MKLCMQEDKLHDIRCRNCGKKLAKAEGKGKIKCPRCKEITEYDTEAQEAQV